MLFNRKTYSLPAPLHRDPQNPMTWQNIPEARSSAVTSCRIPQSWDGFCQQRPCPQEGDAETAAGGMLSLAREALWSWHVALAAMWPVPATERRCCISLQSGTVPGGRWSSSRGPSNHSSDCTRRSFAVTYYHQVNFLKWERASNSGTNGNTEYF